MTPSPASLHFEINLWLCNSENINPRVPQDVVLAHAHDFLRDFRLQLPHLSFPLSDIHICAKVDITICT